MTLTAEVLVAVWFATMASVALGYFAHMYASDPYVASRSRVEVPDDG